MLALFGSAAAHAALPGQAEQPAAATGQAAAATDSDDENDVVVTGHPPGAAVGVIPPLDVLRARDIHATGATNLNDLLAAIAPELGAAASSSGGRPIVLLNGRRISSFRELRDVPMEAIDRLDIMPEEVALEYGYPPDQKVVNVVLKSNFKSTVGQIAGGTAARQVKAGGNADLTRFQLASRHRTTLNAHIGGDDIASAGQRSIIAQQYDVGVTGQTSFAVPAVVGARAGATVSRDLPGNIQATYNAEVGHDFGHSLGGLSDQLPAELNRSTTLDALHVSSVVNGNAERWQWSVTAAGDLQHESTTTADSGVSFAPGSTRSLHSDLSVDATMNGPLMKLPGGDAAMTLRVAGGAENLHVIEDGNAVIRPGQSHRDSSVGAIDLDIPISGRAGTFRALGTLAVNGNAEVDGYTDRQTLTRLGVGTTWSPIDRLNFIASWNRSEDAPALNQIGAAELETPETPIFDFARAIVARAQVITGGSPDLRSQTRKTLQVSADWQPFVDPNLRVRADYARVDLRHPISNILVSPEFEATFPDRFERDSAGDLLGVDLRPVNFRSAHRETLRIGFDFSKALRSRRPSRQQVENLIDKARAAGIALPELPIGSVGAAPTSFAQQFSNTGRITFSMTDTITFSDWAEVQPGFAPLNYLHGAAVGQTGGQPAEQVQAQLGYFKNGIGGRIGLDWRSATEVTSAGMDTLHFSPVATFDLRVFANVGQDVALVVRHPWLAGTSIRFDVGNVFDTAPRIHNATGAIPFGYNPTMLDPLGRTIMLTLRKQFLPISYYRDQLVHFEQDQLQQH